MIKFYDSMGASQGISVLSDLVDACDFWQSEQEVNTGDIAYTCFKPGVKLRKRLLRLIGD